MHKTTLALILTVTTLAACEPTYVPPIAPEPADTCGAAGYQGLIGQPRAVLAPMNFPLQTRVIGPQDMVTSDFRPDRLNIEYGANDRIAKVSCY